MNLNAIIFDFDGTLADTREAILSAFRSAVEDCGISPARQPSILELVTIPLEESLRIAGVVDKGRLSRALDKYDEHFLKIAAGAARPFPDVPETLNTIGNSGLQRAIATNEVRENLDHLLRSFELSEMFEASICADEVAAAKPATEMIDLLLKRLGALAQNTLVVGDSVLDLQMGKAAGCMTCAVTYGANSSQKLSRCRPDWMIDNFSQLLEIEPVAGAIRLAENSGSR